MLLMFNIKRVVCAISGGVDSAVAAALLKRKGYEVIGVFMRNWDIADETGYCAADKEKEDAEYTCKKIGVSFKEVNFVKEYWNNVFSSLVTDYQDGLTPCPDVLCNKFIKFESFYNYAMHNLGADAVATGHYARSNFGEYLQNFNPAKRAHLLQSVDELKDQTFFLCQIPQNALCKTMFPVGVMTKDQVRKIAADVELHRILKKRESTGICFIGKRNFRNFIEDYIPSKPGKFIDIETGETLGEHLGIHYWTLGQRSLLCGKSAAYYIVEKDVKTQNMLVAQGENHPAFFTQSVYTELPYWICNVPVEFKENRTLQCQFRFQHRNPLVQCVLIMQENNLLVKLSEPLRSLTPGQYAVFYKDGECLGSARIIKPGPSLYTLSLENCKSSVIV